MTTRALWAVAFTLLVGCSTEPRRDEEASAARPPAAVKPVPVAAAAPPAPPAKLEDELSVREPIRHRNLVVYPIYRQAGGRIPVEGALTLGEALELGRARVREAARGGNVNRLLIDNDSAVPLVVMGGEIVTGGQQDRVIAKDVVIPARQRGFEVEVFCVEQGRWHLRSGEQAGFLTSQKAVADAKIRERATIAGEQSDVWKEVEKKQRLFQAQQLSKGRNESRSYAILANEAGVDLAAAEYVQAIERALDEDRRWAGPRAGAPVGFIAAIDGKLVGADVFGSPQLAAKLRAKVLRSFAAEALASVPATEGKRSEPAVPSASSAREFLVQGLNARKTAGFEAGAAKRYRLDAEKVAGETCGDAGGDLIHATLFAK